MNTFNNHTELLYSFLDGDLPEEQELQLFTALASDDNLRNELKDALLINRTIENDKQILTPPAASEHSLFARLGFAADESLAIPIPPGQSLQSVSKITSSAGQQTTVGTKLWSATKRGGSLMLIALLSSLLTAWLLRFGNGIRDEHSNTWLNEMPSQSIIPPTHQSGFVGNSIGISPRPFVITDTVFRTIITQNIIRPSEEQPRYATNTTTDLTSPIHPHSEALTATNTISLEMPSSSAISRPSANQQINQDTNQQHNLLGLSIGARGIVGRSIVWATLPSKEQFPSNIAVNAMYALSPHHSIGLEAGQEAYFQRFFTRDAHGVEYRIEQHPAFIWAGLAYRFTLLPESTFSPFAHVVAGATEVGGMGRGMIGMTYMHDSRTTFLLGAELSNLFYQSENVWYMSPKFGVSYGVTVRF